MLEHQKSQLSRLNDHHQKSHFRNKSCPFQNEFKENRNESFKLNKNDSMQMQIQSKNRQNTAEFGLVPNVKQATHKVNRNDVSKNRNPCNQISLNSIDLQNSIKQYSSNNTFLSPSQLTNLASKRGDQYQQLQQFSQTMNDGDSATIIIESKKNIAMKQSEQDIRKNLQLKLNSQNFLRKLKSKAQPFSQAKKKQNQTENNQLANNDSLQIKQGSNKKQQHIRSQSNLISNSLSNTTLQLTASERLYLNAKEKQANQHKMVQIFQNLEMEHVRSKPELSRRTQEIMRGQRSKDFLENQNLQEQRSNQNKEILKEFYEQSIQKQTPFVPFVSEVKSYCLNSQQIVLNSQNKSLLNYNSDVHERLFYKQAQQKINQSHQTSIKTFQDTYPYQSQLQSVSQNYMINPVHQQHLSEMLTKNFTNSNQSSHTKRNEGIVIKDETNKIINELQQKNLVERLAVPKKKNKSNHKPRSVQHRSIQLYDSVQHQNDSLDSNVQSQTILRSQQHTHSKSYQHINNSSSGNIIQDKGQQFIPVAGQLSKDINKKNIIFEMRECLNSLPQHDIIQQTGYLDYLQLSEILSQMGFVQCNSSSKMRTKVHYIWQLLTNNNIFNCVHLQNLQLLLLIISGLDTDLENVLYIKDEGGVLLNFHKHQIQNSTIKEGINEESLFSAHDSFEVLKASDAESFRIGRFNHAKIWYITPEEKWLLKDLFKDMTAQRFLFVQRRKDQQRVAHLEQSLKSQVQKETNNFQPKISEKSYALSNKHAQKVIRRTQSANLANQVCTHQDLLLAQQLLVNQKKQLLKQQKEEEVRQLHPFTPSLKQGINHKHNRVLSQTLQTEPDYQSLNQKGINDRNTKLFNNNLQTFQQRTDRSSRDIEYEQQIKECTFHPLINEQRRRRVTPTIVTENSMPQNKLQNQNQNQSIRSPSEEKFKLRLQYAREQKNVVEQFLERGNLKFTNQKKLQSALKHNTDQFLVTQEKIRLNEMGIEGEGEGLLLDNQQKILLTPLKLKATNQIQKDLHQQSAKINTNKIAITCDNFNPIPVLYVDVNTGKGAIERVALFEDTDVIPIAQNITTKYGFSQKTKLQLQKMLFDKLFNVLIQIDEDKKRKQNEDQKAQSDQ